jgi:YHS domain-containing protein
MKKLILWMLLAMLVTPGVWAQGYAADETTPAGIPTIPARSHGLDGQSSQTGIVDAGNKMCPVMDEPVDGEHFVVYEGKRYGLCCPGCEKAFLADPAQYIAKVNAEKTADEAASEEMQRDMEQAEL